MAALSFSFGRGDLYRTPDITIEWAGFSASAWVLQRAGWRFEEIVDRAMGSYRMSIAMEHRGAGWAGVASCDASYCMQMLHDQIDRRHDSAPTFVVERMVNRADRIVIERQGALPLPTTRGLDFEPAIMEMPRRFTLADILPGRREEEIIVEPETVAGLLEKIKQLQAPELARIREDNRKRASREARDVMQRMREVRHATILTITE